VANGNGAEKSFGTCGGRPESLSKQGPDPHRAASVNFRSGSSNRSCADGDPPPKPFCGAGAASNPLVTEVVDLRSFRPGCSCWSRGLFGDPARIGLRFNVGGTGPTGGLHRSNWKFKRPSQNLAVHSSSRLARRAMFSARNASTLSHRSAADDSQQALRG